MPAAASIGPGPLSGGWLVGAWILVAGALALAVGGFVNSYSAVRDAVEPSVGKLAWTIPVLVDVGIAVISGIDLLFTRLDMRVRWLRLVPWTLNAATIWLNVADEHTSIGVVAHATPPVLWIITVELAGHYLRARSGLETTDDGRRRSRRATDRVRITRWLVAPSSTFVIRRWMAAHEERSFERAYKHWWARKQAKWEMQDAYGLLLWRFRAPRELRGRYRYGHLAPTELETTVVHELAFQEPEAPEPLSHVEPDQPGLQPRTDRPTHGERHRADHDDVQSIVATLKAAGEAVNRTIVTQRLRAQGLSISNERADRILADII